MIANDDAALFLERGFGMQIGFGKNPALIVVDLINGFTDSASPLGANMDPEIDHTNALIDCFHAARLPVFFTTVSYDDDALADAGIWARKQKGLAILRTGSDQVKLDPRLHFESSDSLIVKKYASSFFGTDLQTRLTTKMVDTTVIVGCTTSGCVRATAVDALQLGYRPIVVKEAVGDRSRTAHEQSLFDLQAKYCDVLAGADVIRHIQDTHIIGSTPSAPATV
ncbi:isochorismatase family protein [Achromobacter xylosoxidans]